MIHYSCDRCNRSIEPDDDLRFSVNIKIEVALDSSDCDPDDHREQLVELNDILERLDESEREEVTQSAFQCRAFDLCSDCHREYIKNPLALETPAKLGFSEN
jgi:hypothetical protein